MQINNTYSKPTISGAQSDGFDWQASGKMFKMVISGLYSNKPQSITREIWSNAFDAHAMAGKADIPFDVSLPSRWTPEFSVRDYGEGLSHEWMRSKYTVIGLSSKEDTNLAVGKWGVGRMSPLSYIDTFSVVSIHKGMKAVYNVTMAEDGSPSLNTLIPPAKTDEPSGLQVSFPVKPEDYTNFVREAKRVSLGFNVKPTVGGDSFDWPKFEVGTTGKGYKTYTRDYDTNISGVVAQMGCVIYPIDLSQLGLAYDEITVFSSMNLILDAPIGSVEVTASREDLSYGPKEPTKPFLTQKLKDIKQALVKDTQDAVDACDSMYKAYATKKKSNLHYRLSNLVTYKGQKLDRWEYADPLTKFKSAYPSKVKKENVYRGTTLLDGLIVGYKGGPKNDKRLETRARAHVRDNKGEYIYLTYEWDSATKKYNNASTVDATIAFFGSDLVIKGTDLDDVAPVSRARAQAKVYDFNYDEITVDMEDGGVYVKAYGGSVQGLSWTYSYRSMNCAKGKTQAIVNKNLWKKFDEHPKWVNITDAIEKEFKAREKEIKEIVSKGGLRDRLQLRDFKDAFGQEVKEYYRLLDSVKVDPQEYSDFTRILSARNIYQVDPCPTGKLLDLNFDRFYKKYPLMKNFRRSEKDDFIQYVKAIDLLNGQKK